MTSPNRVRVWRDTPPTETLQTTALNLIPGYNDTDTDTPRIRLASHNLAAYASEANAAAAARYENALAASTDAAEIVDAYLAREDAHRRVAAVNEARDRLNVMQRQARNARYVTDDDTTPALEYLHTQLTELLDTVRVLAPTLEGIDDADEALEGTTTQINAWKTLTDSCDRYDDIRRAQRTIVNLADSTRDNPERADNLRRYGIHTDSFGIDPFHVQDRALAASSPKRDRDNTPYLDWLATFPPFPIIDRLETDYWPDADRQAHMLWLANHKAAWVPTIPQLDATRASIQDLTTPVDTWPRLLTALAAYDLLYTSRKVKPLHKLDTAAIRRDAPERASAFVEPLSRAARDGDDSAYLRHHPGITGGY